MPVRWILTGIATVIFCLGFMAGTCGKATTAELNTAHDSTTAAVERAENAEDARAELEIEARAAIAIHEASRDSAIAEGNRAGNRRTTVVERIIERAGPDSAVVRIAVEEVVDSLVTHEIRPLKAALIQADSIRLSLTSLLSAEQNARLAAQEALGRALEERDLLRDARPSWLARVAPKAGYAALGYLAGRYLVPR